MGVGAKYTIPGTGIKVGAEASIGDDGYGGKYAGVDVNSSVPIGGASASGLKLTGSVGISTNFSSVNTYGTAGLRQGSLGISMSSTGRLALTTGMGTVGINNNQAGRISTQSTDYSQDIPTPFGEVHLGYNYTRYWSDETDNAFTNGSLYYPTSYNASEYDNHAYDTYRLLDPVTENIIDNPDPDKVQGGSFADYDDYYVMAQGLSGSMQPFAPTLGLVNRTKKDIDKNSLISSANIQYTNGKMNYRFIHDFSNQYRQQPANYWYNQNGGVAYPFDSQPSYGNNDGNFGYTTSTNRLVGSKNIESFTNQEIINGSAAQKGFINTKSTGFARDNNTQVGGFMVTNESGVTYHYALPAYSYNEHVYTELISRRNGLNYNHLTKSARYAYTWFLTAVTGPDYVDRGPAGLDASDWGYWVNLGILGKFFLW